MSRPISDVEVAADVEIEGDVVLVVLMGVVVSALRHVGCHGPPISIIEGGHRSG